MTATSLARACALLAALAVGGPSMLAAQARARPLDWLEGCWERRNETRVTRERWLRLRDGALHGTSLTAQRSARGDSLVASEVLRIEARGDTLVLVAQPSGQPGAEFRAASASGRAVTFENAAHDFPQRVRYAAVGADSLVARIEGEEDGVTRAVDFRFGRVGCG